MSRFWIFTADHSGLPLAIRIEYNCETVYCRGEPIFCNLDIEEKLSSFNLATLWARDDYQEDKESNAPLHRFHLMKKFKLI